MAEYYLKNKMVNQRTLRTMHWQKMKNDMVANRWHRSTDSVGFNWEGHLANGQHRMKALFESGITLLFHVVWGLTEKEIFALDSRQVRSLEDQLTMSGHPFQKEHSSTLNWAAGTKGNGKLLSRQSMQQLMLAMKDSVLFAVSNTKPNVRSVSIGPVRGVIARAYYSCDHGRLARFCHLLVQDQIVPKDDVENMVVRFRQTLTTDGVYTPTKTTAYNLDLSVHEKTKSVLRAFLGGYSLQKFIGTDANIFPLPFDPKSFR